MAPKDILAEAMKLPLKKRREFAEKLLRSLEVDAPVDEDAEALWEEEIKRRLALIDSGKAELRDWDEVKESALKRLGRGRKGS